MAKAGLQGGEEFIRDVEEWYSIAKDFVARADKTVTQAVQAAARAGLGPGDRPYPKYLPDKKGQTSAYEKKKRAAAGKASEFLWGLEDKRYKKGGAAGHMLDLRNFHWEKIDETTVQLVWQASGKASDYAEAHNEGIGNMPKREWMHLEANNTLRIIDSLIKQIADDHTEQFNAKHGR